MPKRKTAKLELAIDELLEEIGAPGSITAAELPSPAPVTAANRRFYSTVLGRALIGLGAAALIGLGVLGYALNNSGSGQVATRSPTPPAVQTTPAAVQTSIAAENLRAIRARSSCSKVGYTTFYDGPNLKYFGFENYDTRTMDLGDWVLDHENHPSKFAFPESFRIGPYQDQSRNFRIIVWPQKKAEPHDLFWEEGLELFNWMKESNNYNAIRLWDTSKNCTLSLKNQPALAANLTPIPADAPVPVPTATNTPTPTHTPTDTPMPVPTAANTPTPTPENYLLPPPVFGLSPVFAKVKGPFDCSSLEYNYYNSPDLKFLEFFNTAPVTITFKPVLLTNLNYLARWQFEYESFSQRRAFVFPDNFQLGSGVSVRVIAWPLKKMYSNDLLWEEGRDFFNAVDARTNYPIEMSGNAVGCAKYVNIKYDYRIDSQTARNSQFWWHKSSYVFEP